MQYSFVLLAAAVAVQASPYPQAVTSAISPSAPPPAGCSPNYSGTFGIAVMNATGTADSGPAMSGSATASGMASSAPVSSISDGQPQATTAPAPVTTISDGQPQASTAQAVSTISDGQPQAPTATMTMTPVNQITDGQIQNTAPLVSTISDHQPQAPTSAAAPITTISDHQPQAPTSTAAPITTISDHQPQAPTSTAAPITTISDHQPQAPTSSASAPVSTISDHQPQAPTSSAVGTMSDGQPTASGSMSAASASGSMAASAVQHDASNVQMVSCKASDTLQITLQDGILHDNTGRTGYIASNYQFQFDGPPQAGAIYTAGFSVCGNGSLALGGSAIFYQCLSGDFYNLYDRDWAAQCSPITINVVELMNC